MRGWTWDSIAELVFHQSAVACPISVRLLLVEVLVVEPQHVSELVYHRQVLSPLALHVAVAEPGPPRLDFRAAMVVVTAVDRDVKGAFARLVRTALRVLDLHHHHR